MNISSPTIQETLTDLLSHLIRMPSISRDTATNAAALDWIQEQLRGTGLSFTRYVNNGYPVLIAHSPGNSNPKNPRLWLAGHIDVVPAAPRLFEPRIEGDRLVGRGAFDMKYGLAIYIALLQELAPELANYDLGLMITADEELGSAHGAKWLAETHHYRGQAMLLPECGDSWTLETGAKGKMEWKLESQGRSSHAARPWEGLNAIDELIRFITSLQSHVPTEPCGHPDHAHATVNVGQISGGEAANQVAGHAQAVVDVRFPAGISLDDVRSWFAEAASVAPGVKAEYLTGDPAFTNLLDGPITLFSGLTEEITGRRLVPSRSHGTSDGRFFAPLGVPVITVPLTGGGQHSDHEWISLESLAQYYEITRRFTSQWARIQP